MNLTRNIGSGASHKELGLRALMGKAVGVLGFGVKAAAIQGLGLEQRCI